MMMISNSSIVDGRELDTRISFDKGIGGDNGQFYYPFGIAIDQASGNVYVVDTGNNRIQVFTRNSNFIGTWGTDALLRSNP
jgi:DNA-binding beta-propeller fold protein YncE